MTNPRTAPIADPKAWLSGKPPTRDEVVFELGIRIQELFNGPLSEQRKLSIDRLMAARDYFMAIPRERQELGA